MLRKLYTYKKSIVALLLMAIPSVYVCEILCDLDIYSMKRTCHTSICSTTDSHDLDHITASASKHNHHDSDVDHEHDVPSQHHNKPTHDQEHKDDCCEDMTSSVFEALIIQKLEIPSLEAKLFLIFDVEVPSYYFSYTNILTEPFKFYSDSSPPLPGDDIFILVQSFLL
jgi:hypothetical protein